MSKSRYVNVDENIPSSDENFVEEQTDEHVDSNENGVTDETNDWDSMWQSALELPDNTTNQAERRAEEIRRISSEFADTASKIGKIIIEEYATGKKNKTIRPIKIGGVAGGEKFRKCGIIFKFARDWKNLYGGHDDLAAKAADKELLALQIVAGERQEGLSVPLTCLIDFLGFRLVASAVIARLSKDSLVSGSSDCGRTIRSEECAPSETRDAIRKFAKKLNLRPHYVSSSTSGEMYLVSLAADVEIHRFGQNRNVLLDAARLLPPTTPIRKFDQLIKQFRPELMLNLRNIAKEKGLPSSLSSDAYSGFSTTRDAAQLNRDVDAVTKYLCEDVVSKVRHDLISQRKFWKSKLLPEFLHRRGLNLRYLGLLRASIKPSTPALIQLRDVLLNEIIARVMKNEVRNRIRERCCKDDALEDVEEVVVTQDAVRDDDDDKEEEDPCKNLMIRIHLRYKHRRDIKTLFSKIRGDYTHESLSRDTFLNSLYRLNLIWDHSYDDKIWKMFCDENNVVTRKNFFNLVLKFRSECFPKLKRIKSSDSSDVPPSVRRNKSFNSTHCTEEEEEEEEGEENVRMVAKKLIVSCLNLVTSNSRSWWWTSTEKGAIKRSIQYCFRGALSKEELKESYSIAPTHISILRTRLQELLCFELRERKRKKKKTKRKLLKKKKGKKKRIRRVVVEEEENKEENEKEEENKEDLDLKDDTKKMNSIWQSLDKSKVAVMIEQRRSEEKYHEHDLEVPSSCDSCFRFPEGSDKALGRTGKSTFRIKDVKSLNIRCKRFFLSSSVTARVLLRSGKETECSYRKKCVESSLIDDIHDKLLRRARDEYTQAAAKFELWRCLRPYDQDALRGHAISLIRRACLPCYVENADVEAMFSEARLLLELKTDIMSLHVLESYALVRREMYERAAVEATYAIQRMSGTMKAAALHVKSLCTQSVELQRESRYILMKKCDDDTSSSPENFVIKISQALNEKNVVAFRRDDKILCALQSLEFALRYPQQGLKHLMSVVLQLIYGDDGNNQESIDCVVLSVLARTLLLIKNMSKENLKIRKLYERCVSLFKSNYREKGKEENELQIDFFQLLFGFHFEIFLSPSLLSLSSSSLFSEDKYSFRSRRNLRRLRLRIGSCSYGLNKWRIFFEGPSLERYVSSIEITLDPTLFDDFTRILKHTPYEVVGIGSFSFSFQVRVNFKNVDESRSFTTRYTVNLDEPRTERCFVVVV